MRDDLEFQSTKTYTHSIGLSCCFRQWRAESHCRFLHGYALQVKLTFTSPSLDENNWVIDFGGLKPIKAWLENTFDHKLLVARDDPMKDQLIALAHPTAVHTYEEAEEKRIADVQVVKDVGCEAFSLMIYEHVEEWLRRYCEDHYLPNAYLESVEVREHESNSAICRRKSVVHVSKEPHFHLQPNHVVERIGDLFVIRDKDMDIPPKAYEGFYKAAKDFKK